MFHGTGLRTNFGTIESIPLQIPIRNRLLHPNNPHRIADFLEQEECTFGVNLAVARSMKLCLRIACLQAFKTDDGSSNLAGIILRELNARQTSDRKQILHQAICNKAPARSERAIPERIRRTTPRLCLGMRLDSDGAEQGSLSTRYKHRSARTTSKF